MPDKIVRYTDSEIIDQYGSNVLLILQHMAKQQLKRDLQRIDERVAQNVDLLYQQLERPRRRRQYYN